MEPKYVHHKIFWSFVLLSAWYLAHGNLMVTSLHAVIVRHISRMWKLAELRYEDPALFLKDPSRFLSPASGRSLDPVLWTGQVNEGEDSRKLLSSASNIHITLKSDNSLDYGVVSHKILTVDGLQVRLFHKGYSYFQGFGQHYHRD